MAETGLAVGSNAYVTLVNGTTLSVFDDLEARVNDVMSLTSSKAHFLPYLKRKVISDPANYERCINVSATGASEMPDPNLARFIQREFRAAIQLGYDHASNPKKVEQQLYSWENSKLWRYVVQRVAKHPEGMEGLVQDEKPEKTAFKLYKRDLSKLFKFGVEYAKREIAQQMSNISSWKNAARAAILVLGGMIPLYFLAVHDMMNKTQSQVGSSIDAEKEALGEHFKEPENYMPHVREALTIVVNDEEVRKTAYTLIDDYIAAHPEMVYDEERMKKGITDAVTEAIEDPELRQKLGEAIAQAMMAGLTKQK